MSRSAFAAFVLVGVVLAVNFAAPVAHGAPVPAHPPLEAPRLLPGDASASANRPQASDSWLVGAGSGPATRRLARRYDAEQLLEGAPVYRVPRAAAPRFVAALRARGLYQYSEPDVKARTVSFPSDPLTAAQWALPAIGVGDLTPPLVAADGPLLAVIETSFDASHPEFAGAPITTTGPFSAGDHGTAVTSVAAAPANGRGIVGAFPGARVVVSGLDGSCGSAAQAIQAALDADARIINMSYVILGGCYTHYVATNLAYGAGVTLVAAAGNEGEVGLRTYVSPASDPHVVTVAATTPGDRSPEFSNANEAVDVAAPGVDVLAAVPPGYDIDGTPDGYMPVSGTSISAPLVAGAGTWVATLRPKLSGSQLTDLLRTSARDVGPDGWDVYFGFGAFELPRALNARAPVPDPLEPNDDVEWVDGRRFNSADTPIHRGRGVLRFRARVDRYEDPLDVYRILVPGRSATVIDVRPLFGDPDLELYAGWARTVTKRRGRLVGSYRPGRYRDRAVLSNSYRRRLAAWVVVFPGDTKILDAGYRLQVRRGRFTRR